MTTNGKRKKNDRVMRVFISYSRANSDLVDALADSLIENGFDVLLDRRSLPFGEEWQTEISEFIRTADVTLWAVSPEAISSPIVEWELSEVLAFDKKIVPVHVSEIDLRTLPAQLSKLHVFPVNGTYDHSRDFEELCDVLRTDYAWVRAHTRLLDQATDWKKRDKASDLLLRGGALKRASLWQNQPRAAPLQPNRLVLDLVGASERQASRQSRRVAFWSICLTFIAILVTAASLYFRQLADDNRVLAESQRDRALTIDSIRLAEASDAALADYDPGKALALALSALPSYMEGERPVSWDAVGSLMRAQHQLRQVQVFGAHGDAIEAIYTNPDGDRLVTVSTDDASARLWSLPDGAPIAVLDGHHQSICCVAFGVEDKIFTAGHDGVVRVWNARNGFPLAPLDEDFGSVSALTVAESGDLIAGNANGQAFQVSNRNRIENRSGPLNGNAIDRAVYRDSDKTFVVETLDGVFIVNARTELVEQSLLPASPVPYWWHTLCRRDENERTCGSLHNRTLLSSRGTRAAIPVSKQSLFNDGLTTPEGPKNDNVIEIWDTNQRTMIGAPNFPNPLDVGELEEIAFNVEGTRAIFQMGLFGKNAELEDAGHFFLWQEAIPDSYHQIPINWPDKDFDEDANVRAWSADADLRTLFIAVDTAIIIFDVQTETLTAQIQPLGTVKTLEYNDSSNLLVVGFDDGRVEIWTSSEMPGQGWRHVSSIGAHTQAIEQMYHSDAHGVLVSRSDSETWLWDDGTAQAINKIEDDAEIRFLESEETFAMAQWSHLALWSKANLRETRTISFEQAISQMMFEEDDRFVLVRLESGTVCRVATVQDESDWCTAIDPMRHLPDRLEMLSSGDFVILQTEYRLPIALLTRETGIPAWQRPSQVSEGRYHATFAPGTGASKANWIYTPSDRNDAPAELGFDPSDHNIKLSQDGTLLFSQIEDVLRAYAISRVGDALHAKKVAEFGKTDSFSVVRGGLILQKTDAPSSSCVWFPDANDLSTRVDLPFSIEMVKDVQSDTVVLHNDRFWSLNSADYVTTGPVQIIDHSFPFRSNNRSRFALDDQQDGITIRDNWQSGREILAIEGFDDGIVSYDALPDKNLVALLEQSGSIQLWDMESAQLISETSVTRVNDIYDLSDSVFLDAKQIRLSNDGTNLFAFTDSAMTVYEIPGLEPRATIELFRTHHSQPRFPKDDNDRSRSDDAIGDRISDIAVTAGSSMKAAARQNRTFEPVSTSSAWLEQSDIVVLTGADQEFFGLKHSFNETTQLQRASQGPMRSIVVSADGQTAFTGHENARITKWNVTFAEGEKHRCTGTEGTFELDSRIDYATGLVAQFGYSTEETESIAQVCIFSLIDLDYEPWTIPLPIGDDVYGAQFLDGFLFLSFEQDAGEQLWVVDLVERTHRMMDACAYPEVGTIQMIETKRAIALIHGEDSFCLTGTQNGVSIETNVGNGVSGIDINPSQNLMMVHRELDSDTWAIQSELWRIQNSSSEIELQRASIPDDLRRGAMSPDGQFLAFISAQGKIRILDGVTLTELKEIVPQADECNAFVNIVFSPNSEYMAAACSLKTRERDEFRDFEEVSTFASVQIIDLGDLEEAAILPIAEEAVSLDALFFSDNSKFLYAKYELNRNFNDQHRYGAGVWQIESARRMLRFLGSEYSYQDFFSGNSNFFVRKAGTKQEVWHIESGVVVSEIDDWFQAGLTGRDVLVANTGIGVHVLHLSSDPTLLVEQANQSLAALSSLSYSQKCAALLEDVQRCRANIGKAQLSDN